MATDHHAGVAVAHAGGEAGGDCGAEHRRRPEPVRPRDQRHADRPGGAAESHAPRQALTEELEQHLLAELDFLEEAHNAELISAVIAEYSDDLFVPEVIHPYVTAEVLVMERRPAGAAGSS